MNDERYLALLEKARKEAPKIVEKGSRFKIPALIGYIEGSKTVIQNFHEVKKALNRDEEHILYFLAKELGTAYLKKGGTIFFQGRFSFEKINKKLKKYIDIYVICPVCQRPDTRIMKEKKVYYLKCEACGAMSPVKKA